MARLPRNEPFLCPICDQPIERSDLCATDISEGTCHAECLEGCPIVDLETGEPSDGPIGTFHFDEDDDLGAPR